MTQKLPFWLNLFLVVTLKSNNAVYLNKYVSLLFTMKSTFGLECQLQFSCFGWKIHPQGVYNSWNLKTILEISLNLYVPPGNFCVKRRWSTLLVSSHYKTGYRIAYLRNWSPFFIFATTPCPVFVLGKLIDLVHCIAGCSNATCPGFFLKSLLESPGKLLEICSVKFVDTLTQYCMFVRN